MKNQAEIALFKQKALQWANQFEVCCFFDSNNYLDPYSQYDFVVAAGVSQEIIHQMAAPIISIRHNSASVQDYSSEEKQTRNDEQNAFQKLQSFYETNKTWLFGYFSYDLKNEIENLQSENLDKLNFPDLYFFIPKYLIVSKEGKLEVLIGDKHILNIIDSIVLNNTDTNTFIEIQSRISKASYLKRINSLKEHIKRGDIYEINFCQEFFATHAYINPITVFTQLNNLSPTPFAGYFKLYDKYILSATPERFMCKRGNKLISQPIKGTAKRSKNLLEDEQQKTELRNSIKEQSENVMIVDLVRNDLTKNAVKGTVKVDELFGIYSFAQVHQMISTISCELNPNIHFIEAIKNVFPMGSMTGAPKIKAMELIEAYEKTKRGLYSGSFGCISPNGDFDFNVVIRSILYNQTAQYLSFQVGGAITYQADAEKEYEECLLKASAIMQVLHSSYNFKLPDE